MEQIFRGRTLTREAAQENLPKNSGGASLQDRFLAGAVRARATLDVYMKNESLRRGRIVDYDNWSILLISDSKQYLLFKSSIMGIIPLAPLRVEGIPDSVPGPSGTLYAKVSDSGPEPYFYGSRKPE